MITIEEIRKEFPLLEGLNQDGCKLVYLDSAATTQKPRQVIEQLTNYYTTTNANIHRGTYDLAEKATRDFEKTRTQIQQFIHAEKPEEIIFVSGTTEAVNLVADSYVEPILNAGNEIVVSAMEHHSNLVPWQQLCLRKNAKMQVLPMNEQGEIRLEKLADLLSGKTKLVAVSHISNALGTINPVKEIVSIAHEYGVPVLVDGAQNAGHHRTDVVDLDCDFYAFSGHKMYGPTGIGILYGKEKWLEQMRPYRYGGEMVKTVRFEKSSFKELPHKFEAGTPNIAGVAGLQAAVAYIENLGIEYISEHSYALLNYATEKFLQIRGITIIGQAASKSGIISLTAKDIHPHDMSTFLNEYGIAVRAGHHCSLPVMEFFKIPGTTRISFGIYNTTKEIDYLVQCIEKAIKYFA